MILEADKQTGVVRKHYIGMVTMLDILAQIAGDDDKMDGGDGADLDQRMSVEVSSIIGHCLEGMSLWTLNPNTSILDCMEVFSKGIHRALVPVDSNMVNITGVELAESASAYRMLTQMDLLKFLNDRQSDTELANITSKPINQLGAIIENVFAITELTKFIKAIKCMRAGLLNAVPIVGASTDVFEEDHKQLINGRGKKLIGTFSATDLRGCNISTLHAWLPLSALEFTETISNRNSPLFTEPDGVAQKRELVTCGADSSLAQVIHKGLSKHVHRVWVVDSQGLLQGLVSLTDIIRVLRLSLTS
ncbi:hypothetical protein UlMin_017272 [Ulmus minor]